MRLPAYQELSKEQDAINNLPLDGSYLVTGPPGTGKTVMAIYRAKMLSDADRKVQLLMYSRLLSQYTETAVDELDIEGITKTFHTWFASLYCRHFHRRYAPQFAPYVFDWMTILEQINENPPQPDSLENLLIDEGQDLPPESYYVIRHLSRNRTVFADENQRLTDGNSTLKEIRRNAGLEEHHELRRNYRNTREIAMLAQDFCTGLSTGVPNLPERRGEMPRVVHTPRLYETVDFITRYENTWSDLSIGVLTPTEAMRKRLVNRLEGKTVNPVQTYIGGQGADAEIMDFEDPGIRVVNYASAKGLEFDTVFLPELQHVDQDHTSPEFKMRFFVLTSRARNELFLMYSGEGEPAILEVFPRDLVEWP